ncbi:MAG: hypothetical protein ACK5HL_03485 [Bacilli bacterium]
MINENIAYKILENQIKNNRCAHAHLFEVSEKSEQMWFIKKILCRNDVCNKCIDCQKVDNFTHERLYALGLEDKQIKKAQIIEFRSIQSENKLDKIHICLINNAENLNASSGNAILKFLEEPQENMIFILTTKNLNLVLPTIKSRCVNLILNTTVENNLILNDKYKEEFILFLNLPNISSVFNFIQKYYNKNDLFENISFLLYNINIVILNIIKQKLNSNKINDFEFKIFDSFSINQLTNMISKNDELINDMLYNVNKKMVLDKFIINLEEIWLK